MYMIQEWYPCSKLVFVPLAYFFLILFYDAEHVFFLQLWFVKFTIWTIHRQIYFSWLNQLFIKLEPQTVFYSNIFVIQGPILYLWVFFFIFIIFQCFTQILWFITLIIILIIYSIIIVLTYTAVGSAKYGQLIAK